MTRTTTTRTAAAATLSVLLAAAIHQQSLAFQRHTTATTTTTTTTSNSNACSSLFLVPRHPHVLSLTSREWYEKRSSSSSKKQAQAAVTCLSMAATAPSSPEDNQSATGGGGNAERVPFFMETQRIVWGSGSSDSSNNNDVAVNKKEQQQPQERNDIWSSLSDFDLFMNLDWVKSSISRSQNNPSSTTNSVVQEKIPEEEEGKAKAWPLSPAVLKKNINLDNWVASGTTFLNNNNFAAFRNGAAASNNTMALSTTTTTTTNTLPATTTTTPAATAFNKPSSNKGIRELAASAIQAFQTSQSDNILRNTLRRLATLALEDFEWRTSVFQKQEADRMVELSVARMMGYDSAPYIRPMDAASTSADFYGGLYDGETSSSANSDGSSERTKEKELGPLGKLEKATVTWLSKVFEEEERRAQQIVQWDGKLVRPIDLARTTTTTELGPLGNLEQTMVDFVNSIRTSEKERVRTQTLRPKDLEESKRGPLGQLEESAVRFVTSIQESERVRAQMSRMQQVVVRPIDVPGPLGEFELAVTDLIRAEEKRSRERQAKTMRGVLRPKDATWKGPLGEAEQRALNAIEAIQQEELARLKSICNFIKDNRPMEKDPDSVWGKLEMGLVGVLHAPRLLMHLANRVKELMNAEKLNDLDQKLLNDYKENNERRRKNKKKG